MNTTHSLRSVGFFSLLLTLSACDGVDDPATSDTSVDTDGRDDDAHDDDAHDDDAHDDDAHDDDAHDDDTDSSIEAPDIVGSYVEEFPGGQSLHDIAASTWEIDYDDFVAGYTFARVDNDARFVVGEDINDAGVFAKLQWTFLGDDLYYCTVIFAATSVEEAEAAPAADDSDPEAGGCGDFTWSRLEPR